MKRKWLISFAVPIVAALVVLFWSSPTPGKAPINVTFLAATNDGTGAKWILFCATNGTRRLFVRGNSAVEWQASPSNQIRVVQITNVDYLKPGQALSFSMRSPALGQPWRLSFTYIGQFGRFESLEYETGWFLRRHHFDIDSNKLPRHDVREITTQWLND